MYKEQVKRGCSAPYRSSPKALIDIFRSFNVSVMEKYDEKILKKRNKLPRMLPQTRLSATYRSTTAEQSWVKGHKQSKKKKNVNINNQKSWNFVLHQVSVREKQWLRRPLSANCRTYRTSQTCQCHVRLPWYWHIFVSEGGNFFILHNLEELNSTDRSQVKSWLNSSHFSVSSRSSCSTQRAASNTRPKTKSNTWCIQNSLKVCRKV